MTSSGWEKILTFILSAARNHEFSTHHYPILSGALQEPPSCTRLLASALFRIVPKRVVFLDRASSVLKVPSKTELPPEGYKGTPATSRPRVRFCPSPTLRPPRERNPDPSFFPLTDSICPSQAPRAWTRPDPCCSSDFPRVLIFLIPSSASAVPEPCEEKAWLSREISQERVLLIQLPGWTTRQRLETLDPTRRRPNMANGLG